MPDRMNINEATREDIEKLPFMGAQRAEMIVHHREVNGPYKKQSDLEKVTGMNERLAQRIAEYFDVSEMTTSEDESDDRGSDRSSARRTRSSSDIDREADRHVREDVEGKDDDADDEGDDDSRGSGSRGSAAPRKRAASR